MSLAKQAVAEIGAAREFFNRSTRNLTEAHSTFAPTPGAMTAAQQVAHVAQTIDWFVAGVFSPAGFDTNWEEHARVVNAFTSLAAARAWFEKAIAGASATMGSKSDAELLARMAEGPIMGGQPRMAIISGITDHTAHHRGVLTVYARLNHIVPPMPYMDM